MSQSGWDNQFREMCYPVAEPVKIISEGDREMENDAIGRRTFLKGMAVTALTSIGTTNRLEASSFQYAVSNSTGAEAPTFKAPPNACDSHIHIYDPRFAMTGPTKLMPANATVSDYRLLQRRNRTSRTVVVTPANYMTDNRCTLDAVSQLGRNSARGIAVIHPDITDAELTHLAEGGIRGIRFTVFDPATAVTKIDTIEPLSKRVNELGWHVQIHMRADQIVENAAMLQRLPSPIVFDHMGRMRPANGIEDPAFSVILRLIDKGRTWVKLAGAYLNTKIGPPTYADATKIAEAYVTAAPERLVWGSDWPHPTEQHEKPNDSILFDLLAAWAPDENNRRRILVDNPAALYGFSS